MIAHSAPVAEIASRLESDAERGLTVADATDRLVRVGANALERKGNPPYLRLAARQLTDPLVALLLAAVVVSAAIGERVEAIAIGVIVLLNGLLGFGQEMSAERAVLALRGTLRRRATAIRDGRERELPAEELVPGDVIVLREGERVPADARVATARGLAVDESALTGESMPVDKGIEPVPEAVPLAERSSMVFAGTGVTRGRGRALVTATGSLAEIGQAAELAARARPPATPLQRRLAGLSRAMVAAGVVITVCLAGIRLLQGAPAEEAFLLGVSVAVAAVPEGLAATVTIALALGARRMAARGAIVRRLLAVETLGSATVVASDKTGTLTQNRLSVHGVEPATSRDESGVLEAAVLASTAELVDRDGELQVAGDPVEGALLLAARERGIKPRELRSGRRLVLELPFEAERKQMTLAWEENGAVHAFTKGAPEVVLARCRGSLRERRRLQSLADDWAARGLRVLAFAERTVGSPGDLVGEEVNHALEPLGLVALHDPLRDTAAGAVRSAREAGLRVQLITGDHPATAAAIARELELPEDAVSARVTPRDKLRLVEALQRDGEVVAVTGDGVNDAPALRRADVGVAMGRSGTQAAREAADVVLTDDDFSTIVAAIREGRAIAENVRKFVAFLLSANLGEVLLFAAAVLAGLGAPMTVVQVLAVNVVTDGLPAVALARDPASKDVMERGPERNGRLFGRNSWAALGLVGMIVGAAGLGALLVGRGLDESASQTMAFTTIALGELALVFALRSPQRPAWREGRNPWLAAGVATSAAMVALAVYLPPLHEAFGTVALDGPQVATVLGFAIAPFALVELGKALFRRAARRGRREGRGSSRA